MSGYLVDTNVVAELTKTAPDRMVIKLPSEHQDLSLCIMDALNQNIETANREIHR